MKNQEPTDEVREASDSTYLTREDLERKVEFYKHSRDFLIIANRAVRKAREENTRLGVPNWSYIDGKVVAEP